MIVGLLELRFQASDFGIGDNRILSRLVTLDAEALRSASALDMPATAEGGAVLQAIDLFTGEGQLGPSALQRDLVRPRIDEEEEIAFFNLLVVTYVHLDDLTVDLWRDSDEIGANCSIIRLRPYLPLE